jgi:hypothetical protein
MMQLPTRFRKVAHQISCRIDDEIAILNLQREIYFGLRGAGVQIWDALDEPCSVSDLCDVVVNEFDVSRADCEADVVEILRQLTEEGLVDVAD